MRVGWLFVLIFMAPAVLWLPLRLGLWIRARWAVRRALAGLTVYHAAFYRRGLGECLDLAAASLVGSGLLHVSREGVLTVAAPGATPAPAPSDAPAGALLESLRARSASQDGELRLHSIEASVPPPFTDAVKGAVGFVPRRMWNDLSGYNRDGPNEQILLVFLLVVGGFVTDMMLVLAYLTSRPVHIGLWTLLLLLAASVAAPIAAGRLERRVIRPERLPKAILARRCQEMLDAHTRTHHDAELADALKRSRRAPTVALTSAHDAVGGPGNSRCGMGCGADCGTAGCGSAGCGSDGGI